ncbi:Intraflagellar transport protein 43, partial [Rhizophlyctis rosea]
PLPSPIYETNTAFLDTHPPDASITPTTTETTPTSPPPIPPPRRSRRAHAPPAATNSWHSPPQSTTTAPRPVSTSQDIGDDDGDDDEERVEVVKKQTHHTVSSRTPATTHASSIPDITMVIPDLEDAEQDEITSAVAAPPAVKVGRVRTIRELDAEGGWERGAEHSPIAGIDLSLLSSIALCPPDQIAEPDVPWDWDVLFTEISSQMMAEMEEAAKNQAAAGGGGLGGEKKVSVV